MIDLITDHRDDLPYWSKVADGEPVDWHEVFEGWESTVDWPACSRWEELMERLPDVPVLLNYRDFDGCYRSCENTIVAVSDADRRAMHQDANREGPSPELWRVIGSSLRDDFQGQVRGQGMEPADVRRPHRANHEETTRCPRTG